MPAKARAMPAPALPPSLAWRCEDAWETPAEDVRGVDGDRVGEPVDGTDGRDRVPHGRPLGEEGRFEQEVGLHSGARRVRDPDRLSVSCEREILADRVVPQIVVCRLESDGHLKAWAEV